VRGIEAFKGDACDGLPLRKMHLYEVRPRKIGEVFDTLPSVSFELPGAAFLVS